MLLETQPVCCTSCCFARVSELLQFCQFCNLACRACHNSFTWNMNFHLTEVCKTPGLKKVENQVSILVFRVADGHVMNR